MPTLIVLATSDPALAESWERQVPPGRTALRMIPQSLPNGTSPGFAAVVVLDAAAESELPPSLVRCPTIFVGEPRSLPYEQAKLSGRAKIYLSYEESATRLREFLPLIEEVAEKQSMLELLAERTRRVEPVRIAARVSPLIDAAELWDFLEGAVESLDARDRLIAEFRRASRHLLRASHAVFFLREAEGFRADRGTSFFRLDDPLVTFFENHPVVIDGTWWEGPADPVAELAIRNRLALWGARLLAPIHENGRLHGLIALGIRDDGQPYDENDRTRVVFYARLLRHFLAKCAQHGRLYHLAEQATLGAKYLPGTLILGAEENPSRQVPLTVRALIGEARASHSICRVTPTPGQPFRASAGPIAETGGTWAFWEEANTERLDVAHRERAERRALLRELGLTLNHELGNALVSLTTFRQAGAGKNIPPPLLEAARGDVAKLEALNGNIGLMQALHEAKPTAVDMRELAQTVSASLGLRVEVGPEPVPLSLARELVEFSLRSLIATVLENRSALNAGELTLQVRSTGKGAELTAMLSLKGKHLELEGILPEPVDDMVPNQGRLGVFLAKEVLRLHQGEIHAGPGMDGTEILISLRSL
jgi:hypothetical protein